MTPAKRAVDVGGATVGLIVTAPVLIVLAIAIRLSDRGPALFSQTRVGRGGRPFRMWKLRTMVVGAERQDVQITPRTDRRITRLGAVLRRLKLDELPQLFNVVAGDMSLVGPRPEVERYVALYTLEQRRVLELTPGITDPASIAYCDEAAILESDPDPERLYVTELMPAKVRLNLEYAARATVWSDIAVVGHTMISVLGRLLTPLRFGAAVPAGR
ncbi:MAG TPA: sugar transferase [Gemmatimonadaceae bacterium]|nr:sugar transferase [Gemmatimonadaceae bacterium]